MPLPPGAVNWSAVRDCSISWSYSLTFFNFLPDVTNQIINIKRKTRSVICDCGISWLYLLAFMVQIYFSLSKGLVRCLINLNLKGF